MKYAFLFLTSVFVVACGRVTNDPSPVVNPPEPTIQQQLNGYWKLEKKSPESDKSVTALKFLKFEGGDGTMPRLEYCSEKFISGLASYNLDGWRLEFDVVTSMKTMIPKLKNIVFRITNLNEEALELNGNIVYKRFHPKTPKSSMDETSTLCQPTAAD